MTMISTMTPPTPSSRADMLMVVSRIGAWTDIGGPGCTGDPAPGGSGAPGGAAGRSTNAPGGPGDCGAGGCDQPVRSPPPSAGAGARPSGMGSSCSLILATPMLV